MNWSKGSIVSGTICRGKGMGSGGGGKWVGIPQSLTRLDLRSRTLQMLVCLNTDQIHSEMVVHEQNSGIFDHGYKDRLRGLCQQTWSFHQRGRCSVKTVKMLGLCSYFFCVLSM